MIKQTHLFLSSLRADLHLKSPHPNIYYKIWNVFKGTGTALCSLSSWAQRGFHSQSSPSPPAPAIAAFRDSSFFFRSSITSCCNCCIFSSSCSSVLFALPEGLVLLQKHGKDWDTPSCLAGYEHNVSAKEHSYLRLRCRSITHYKSILFRKDLFGFFFSSRKLAASCCPAYAFASPINKNSFFLKLKAKAFLCMGSAGEVHFISILLPCSSVY